MFFGSQVASRFKNLDDNYFAGFTSTLGNEERDPPGGRLSERFYELFAWSGEDPDTGEGLWFFNSISSPYETENQFEAEIQSRGGRFEYLFDYEMDGEDYYVLTVVFPGQHYSC